MLAVGDPPDVRGVHSQSLRNARVVKTDVLFVKMEQGLGFLFVRLVLLRLRVNRTGASHVAPPSGHLPHARFSGFSWWVPTTIGRSKVKLMVVLMAVSQKQPIGEDGIGFY